MWLIRVNMTDLTSRVEPLPDAYKHLGGRGMTSTIVAKEVPPLCHPLGPNNKLVFAPGIVTGTPAPTSARVSAGAKSPLTGGIKESNGGSSWAADLADMRVRALVIEGQAKKNGKFWGLHLLWDAAASRPKVEFFDASEYAGKDLFEVFPKVYAKFGDKISISGCGVAGEYGYGNAGIVYNDPNKRPTRYSGRGGLGSVMGSKGLKFIILSRAGAPGVPITDEALFDQGRKKMSDALRTHDLTKPKGALNTYGTAVLINILNEAGGLPTRNFSSGRFEGAAKPAIVDASRGVGTLGPRRLSHSGKAACGWRKRSTANFTKLSPCLRHVRSTLANTEWVSAPTSTLVAFLPEISQKSTAEAVTTANL